MLFYFFYFCCCLLFFFLFFFFSMCFVCFFFFFSSRRRHTRCLSDWSSDVCSSDLHAFQARQRLDRKRDAIGVRVRSWQRRDQHSQDGDKGRNSAHAPWCHPPPSEEIGRASCRERVERWEVAGAMKEKQSDETAADQ